MKKRILSAVLALAMIFTALVPVLASANAPTTPPAETTINIHKIKMDTIDSTKWPKQSGEDGTVYNGEQIGNIGTYFGSNAEELAGVYFTYFKVEKAQYDAMVLAPQNYDTVTKVEGQTIVTDGTPIPAGTQIGPTTTSGLTEDLPEGYYWFVEHTEKALPDGSTLSDNAAVPFGIALPMIKADGTYFATGDNALHLYPKNTTAKVPEVDKDFEGLADPRATGDDLAAQDQTRSYDIGDEVPYEIKTIIPAGAKYKTAYWTDQMTEGLTFNDDVTVLIGPVGSADADKVALGHEVIDVTDRSFRVNLTDAGLAEIFDKPTELEIVIRYTATLNELAVMEVEESNDVIFHYGNNPDQGNTPVPTKPVEGQIDVYKTFEGAGSYTIPEGGTVTYILKNAQTGATIDTVTYNAGATITGSATAPLMTFPRTGATYTLDPDTEYKVEEIITGFSPKYGVNAAGDITIHNYPNDNPPPINPEEPKVVTGGEKFKKIDGTTSEALAGAEFVVKNNIANDPDNGKFLALKDTTEQAQAITEYEDAEAAYQAAVAAATAENPDTANIAALKATRDEKFAAMNMEWKWITEAEAAAGATEADPYPAAFKFTSAQDGSFEVKGLAYGEYQLIETKAPEGYAKLTSPQDFTVSGTSYSDTTIIDIENNKVTIPQTGGMGTIIFVVAGLLIMGTALVVMKKRNSMDI